MGTPFENRTRFQTKMGKGDIRFQTKQNAKTILFRARGTYLKWLVIGYPPESSKPSRSKRPSPLATLLILKHFSDFKSAVPKLVKFIKN